MKKIALSILCVAAMMTSCNNLGGGSKDDLKAENDSLWTAISERNAELDQMMGTFNEIQEGFRQINEAQGRVDLDANAEGANPTQKMKDDLQFIAQTMASNKAQIEKLQKQLNNSTYQSKQLKKAIENLQKELDAKTKQIEALQEELAAKNIRIAELDDAVAGLNEDVSNLSKENTEKDRTVAAQDKALNTAWFVYGTRSELKEQKILNKGDVLATSNFNKDYFTQIDIRTDKEIKLYSKKAELLTTHPEGSYSLEKDAKGQYVLVITQPSVFWSVSRYLVILVK
jgi:chromosome segregation ATPase